ncbi:flagellar export protein FliJ [Dissulfurirhabdus thermomarina]|uniref:Flagellar FliJ protein n=1 Tax=Dissulfurirhabdus thermomarina TaxID=1765737 RepID=A0A6N9TV88_DISTH|nr:flagellar export protein FliJ [Dissulfurirhabdus thermomarina]NDY43347.1 flagellar export protein FliJ [Dissulfurirhabdus thermomarina]NMX23905.1 flagellar export protein FliJ [Dissulfurirhabdus thermomarina]
MPFRFRLAPLRMLRRRRRELAEAALAEALRRRDEVRGALDDLRRDIRRAGDDLDARAREGLLASEYQALAEHIARLRDEAEHLETRLAAVEAEVLAARRTLEQRHQDSEVVERLRQREYRRYIEEEARAEQKAADDLASGRYARNKNGGRQ